ncbi:hypothetical protein BU14_0170s0006 [Porphyra umbilicalis]|uniref:HAT C-terminal dimerisation domain-containing protein n=1 Tax=Porphyra umbilicalis TaxID=2786 RepID=A0A1X6P7M1_PORUM|nr:hypothetical protein BU14_0170s0006 [Porphyra umbilicalis]|eukprot:OSX76891.1 hypothetical protein BU14_0170s0006 [Porphyra umbilicalis]
MTSFSHAFATSAYVRSFLAGFRISHAPPALGTVMLHLSELASFISSILVDLFSAAANDYMSVPWATVCIDMWTVPGSRASYGAPAALELLTRLRATTTFFKHSDAGAQILSAIIVAGDSAIRGLVSEVATCWGSTYLSLARLYSMCPRLSIFFCSTTLTADQRKRCVAHRDWDNMRYLMAILTPVFEVTKECQRTSATLADIFSLVVALCKTLLLDTIVAPKFPEHPLAVGSDSIESFLQENPDDDVIELDNRLYPSEAVYIETRGGYESLCEEAAVAVRIMRDEIDRLFFNPKENAKNWLRNPAVLSAVLLSPGDGRMLREVGDWVGMGDPTAEAETAVLETAAKLQPTAEAFGGCGSAGPLRSTAELSELRVTARSSLVLWQADVSPECEHTLEPSRVDRAAREELSRFRRRSDSAMAGDAMEFWRAHRAQFPALFVVAGSVFGAVGSSASCEREFSIAGRLVASDRSSLSTGSVEMHSLVSSNADLFPYNTASVPSLSHAEAANFRETVNGYVSSTGEAEAGSDDVDTDEEESEDEEQLAVGWGPYD